MFGIDAAIWATGSVAAVLAAAGLAMAVRHWRAAHDDTIDWDVGGDIV